MRSFACGVAALCMAACLSSARLGEKASTSATGSGGNTSASAAGSGGSGGSGSGSGGSGGGASGVTLTCKSVTLSFEAPEVLTAAGPEPRALASYGGFLYWFEGPNDNMRLMRLALAVAKATPEKLAPPDDPNTPTMTDFNSIAVAPNLVFISAAFMANAGVVRAINPQNKTVLPTIWSQAGARDLAYMNGKIYWLASNANGTNILGGPADGTVINNGYIGGFEIPTKLRVSPSYVFYLSGGSGHLYRENIVATDNDRVELAQGAVDLAATATTVYWQTSDGKVHGIAADAAAPSAAFEVAAGQKDPHLLVAAAAVHWHNQNGGDVMAACPEGGGAVAIANASTQTVKSLHAGGKATYWSAGDSSGWKIYRSKQP